MVSSPNKQTYWLLSNLMLHQIIMGDDGYCVNKCNTHAILVKSTEKQMNFSKNLFSFTIARTNGPSMMQNVFFAFYRLQSIISIMQIIPNWINFVVVFNHAVYVDPNGLSHFCKANECNWNASLLPLKCYNVIKLYLINIWSES